MLTTEVLSKPSTARKSLSIRLAPPHQRVSQNMRHQSDHASSCSLPLTILPHQICLGILKINQYSVMSEPKYSFTSEQVRKADGSKSTDGQKCNGTDKGTAKSMCAAADNAEKETKATVIGDERPTKCPIPSQTTVFPPSQAHLDVSEQVWFDHSGQIKAEQAISTGNPIKSIGTREARGKNVKKVVSISHGSGRSGCSPSPGSGGAVCTTKDKGTFNEAESKGKYSGLTMATKRKLLAPAFSARFDADGVPSYAKRHKLTLKLNVSSTVLCAMKELKPIEPATTRTIYRAQAPSSGKKSISTTPKRTTEELWKLAETVDLDRPITRQSSLKVRQPLEESIEELVQSPSSPLVEESITKSPLAGRTPQLSIKQPAEQSVNPTICLSLGHPLNSRPKAQDKQQLGRLTKSSIESIPSDQICSKNLTMSPVTVVFDYKPINYTSPFVATPPRETPSPETLKPKSRRPNKKYREVDGGLVTALQSLNITGGDPCPLFRKWPFEIREMVYKNLLFAGCIEHPDKLVNDKLKTFVRRESHRSFNHLSIDSTFLQTCRRIHDEALPVLYAHNRFMFDDPVAIEVFRKKGLVRVPCKSSSRFSLSCSSLRVVTVYP